MTTATVVNLLRWICLLTALKNIYEEIARLRNLIEEISISNKFCMEQFAGSDDDIRFFKRFASHAHLMAFWKQIEPATCKMERVTRARSVAKNDEVPHTGSATILQPIDKFFLFMT
ncbi:hypothetical protein R3I94_018860 [Phoxinus phoxinus]|uniref:Uncharacterized protein n=1 Tax=Phoxinus phoxinus TaxID=58324 RepID=A0AAN9CNH3_9TELE